MLNQSTEWGPAPIRFLIGIGFIYHGFIKLFTSRGHDVFLRLLTDIGIPAPTAISWIVGGLEFFGGIAIFFGAFLTITSILLIINMLVAMFTVTLPNGFDLMNATVMIEAGPKFGIPGLEINLLYIAGLASLLLTGAGKLSFDLLRKERAGSSPA